MTHSVNVVAGEAGLSPQQLGNARQQRVATALALGQPDRVPLSMGFGNGLADLAGITRRQLYEDAEKQQAALLAAAERFQPDIVAPYPFSSSMSRALGDTMTKWPGYGLTDNASFQFHEQEYMHAEEYDEFLRDLGDWTLRRYLPRTFAALQGLAELPPLGLLAGGFYGMVGQIGKLAAPSPLKALEALADGARARLAELQKLDRCTQFLADHGFPPSPLAGPMVAAPFDFIGDTLRGMRGIFLDIRRCPDKLLAAEEKLIPLQVETAVADCKAWNKSVVTLYLHRGSDGFISIHDFEKFYWPQLKAVLLGLIAGGVTPYVFWEGCWDQRLEYLTELPPGKIISAFQQTDVFKVKQMLGHSMCIVGGMKLSLLDGATSAAEIREYTHRLCQEVGRGGGYIMSTDIFESEGTKPEMLEVWAEATREFGRY